MIVQLGIVLSLESHHEFFISDLLGVEFDIKGMVSFRHNCVVHRGTFETKSFVCYSVESDSGRDLTLIL